MFLVSLLRFLRLTPHTTNHKSSLSTIRGASTAVANLGTRNAGTDFAPLPRYVCQMEMYTKENERLMKTLQLEIRKEAAVSQSFSVASFLTHYCFSLVRVVQAHAMLNSKAVGTTLTTICAWACGCFVKLLQLYVCPAPVWPLKRCMHCEGWVLILF